MAVDFGLLLEINVERIDQRCTSIARLNPKMKKRQFI